MTRGADLRGLKTCDEGERKQVTARHDTGLSQGVGQCCLWTPHSPANSRPSALPRDPREARTAALFAVRSQCDVGGGGGEAAEVSYQGPSKALKSRGRGRARDPTPERRLLAKPVWAPGRVGPGPGLEAARDGRE